MGILFVFYLLYRGSTVNGHECYFGSWHKGDIEKDIFSVYPHKCEYNNPRCLINIIYKKNSTYVEAIIHQCPMSDKWCPESCKYQESPSEYDDMWRCCCYGQKCNTNEYARLEMFKETERRSKRLMPITPTTALPQWPKPSKSQLGKYTKGAIVADHGVCSKIGKKVLMDGGNAVDAAVASVFCVGLMQPQSSGIGGGHIMTIYHRKVGSCFVIDARETAPLAAMKDMYKHSETGSKIGWKSIAVPGELHGLWTAFNRYGSGKIGWKRLLEPSIGLATKGYQVTSQTAKALEKGKKHIFNNPTFDVFINPRTGNLYREGEKMQRPIFANTLKQIALSNDPVQLFYSGKLASTFVKEFESNGALITKEDLSQYSSKIRKEVVETTIKNDFGICGPPPPSSAAVVQSIVKTIDNFGITKSNLSTVQGNVAIYHKFIEAMKFGYARRSELGDISYEERALQIAQNITSESYISWVQKKITENSHDDCYYGGEFGINEEHGTTHLNAVDDEGNAVAVTSTINLHFGSFRRSPKTGIIWNDEMDDFSYPMKTNAFGIPPSPANYIKPGKRPMSSMSPIIIFNKKTGEFKLAVGAAGGSRIISTVAYIIVRAMWFNETIKGSVDAPRLHNQLRPYHTSYEAGFPETYVEQLKLRFQNMKWVLSLTVPSVATAIMGDHGHIYAISDWRKGIESYPAGYLRI